MTKFLATLFGNQAAIRQPVRAFTPQLEALEDRELTAVAGHALKHINKAIHSSGISKPPQASVVVAALLNSPNSGTGRRP